MPWIPDQVWNDSNTNMPLQSYSAKLVKKVQTTPEIHLLTLELPPDRKLEFTPGQYMILHVPREDGDYYRRLYSLANSPSAARIQIVVKKIPNGVATKYVEELAEGATVEFQAPAGLFTLNPRGKDVIMLATNTGIAPFMSMIRHEMEKGPLSHEIYLYWGMRHFDDLYFYDELKQRAQQDPRFHITVCLSREAETREGVIPFRLDKALAEGMLINSSDSSRFDFYICGGVPVIDTLKDILTQRGIPKEQIFFEKFT